MSNGVMGFNGKLVFTNGREERVVFYRRYSVKDLGSIVDFYTENGEKYRYIGPFKNSGALDGYLPHKYYHSVMLIDDFGHVTERWDLCTCWVYLE